jgi:hypothetical protein
MRLTASGFLLVILYSVVFGNTNASPAAKPVSFNLEGRVPTSITSAFLEPRYISIVNSIAPGKPLDTTPITIIYYAKGDRRKLGVRLPEWGGGGAIGRDTIIIPVDKAPLVDMELDRVTLHELVHIAIERSFGRLRIPRWFHEGLAMTLSGEVSLEEQIVISRALLTHRLLPLDSIERVNRFDAFGASLAYSQSHVTVLFMIETWGIDAIPELFAAIRSTGTFDAAFMTVFGLTLVEFERLVQSDINRRFRYLFLIGDTWLYWLPASCLVVVGFILIRIRNKKKLERMEQEERTGPLLTSPEYSPANPDQSSFSDRELQSDGTGPEDQDWEEDRDSVR